MPLPPQALGRSAQADVSRPRCMKRRRKAATGNHNTRRPWFMYAVGTATADVPRQYRRICKYASRKLMLLGSVPC